EVAMAKQDASKDTSKSNKKVVKKVVKKVKKIDKKNKQSDIFNKSFNINSLESPAKESNLKTNFKNKDVNSKKSYYDTFNNSNKTTNNNTALNNEAIAKKYEQVILNNRSTTHSFYESTNKECASAAEKLDYNIVYSQRDTGSVNSSCKKSDLNSVPDSGNINSFDKYKQRANLDIPTDENNENDIYKKYKENNFNTKILTPNKDNPSNNVVNIKKCDISLSKATKSKDLSKGNCSPVKISKKDELDIMFGRQSNKKQKSSKKIVSQSSENTDSVKEVNYALEKSNPVKLFSNNLILKNSVFNSNNVSDSNVNHINCSFDVYQSLHKYDVVSELKSDYKVSDYLLKEEVKVATNITNIKDFKVSKYLKPTDNFDLKEVALDYSYDTNKKNVNNTKVSFITNIKNKLEKAIKFISSIFKHDKGSHKIE
ncbi:MAG: hypothetical protein IJH34_06600, partial [Romboutsia sp.]|nr:hypothetical protein [Romboutsia sp.]